MAHSVSIEELLNEDESSSLDFKRDQYQFDGAPDDVKAELLKDILAFANAWRRSEAYILIGVDEVRGCRSQPVGVSEHLHEAHLQQFVNLKTQRPIDFSYRTQNVDGKSVGVIAIPLQPRPFFLRRDFGGLPKNTVYLRRGSSTAVADPDEIAKMGSRPDEGTPPRLNVAATVRNGHQGEVVISVSNAPGSDPARNLYLEITLPQTFMLSQYGLDGNTLGGHSHGFRLLPQGSATNVVKFQAGTEDVVHPGTSRDVARIDWRGQRDHVPKAVEIHYAVAADGTRLEKGSVPVTFRH